MKFKLTNLNDLELIITIRTYFNAYYFKKNRIPSNNIFLTLFYALIILKELFIEGENWFKDSNYNKKYFNNSITFFCNVTLTKIINHFNESEFLKDEEIDFLFEEFESKVLNWIKDNLKDFNEILPELEVIFIEEVAPYTRKK